MKRVVLFIGVLVAILLLVLTFLTFARDKRPGVIRFSARFYHQYVIGQGKLDPGFVDPFIGLKNETFCMKFYL